MNLLGEQLPTGRFNRDDARGNANADSFVSVPDANKKLPPPAGRV